MTLFLLSLKLPLSKELLRCEVTQGLVRAHGVVSALPGEELLVKGGHLQREVCDLIELLRVGVLILSLFWS